MVHREVLLVFVIMNQLLEGSGSANVVGGGERLLSGSGKYGSLCHF